MECVTKMKDGADVLIDYASGALNAGRAAEFEQHIAGCPACRDLVEAQRGLWRTLDAWPAPEVSPQFDARLYARIAQEDALPAWKQWVRRIFQPAVPMATWKPAVSLAAACAILTVALATEMQHVQLPQQKAQAPQVRVERAVDIEQVADALDDLEILVPGSAM
jgi:anti-sigma factor RsiW